MIGRGKETIVKSKFYNLLNSYDRTSYGERKKIREQKPRFKNKDVIIKVYLHNNHEYCILVIVKMSQLGLRKVYLRSRNDSESKTIK